MFGLMVLGAMCFGGLLLVGVAGLVIKLLFKLIALPFLLLGFVLKLALGLLLLPFIAVGGLVALVGIVLAGLFAVVLPLVPVVLAGFLVVALFKWLSRPAGVPNAQASDRL